MSIYATRQYDGIYRQNPSLATQREAALIGQNPEAAALVQKRKGLENAFDVAEGARAVNLSKQIRALNQQIHDIPLDLSGGNIPTQLAQAETAYQSAITGTTRDTMDKFEAMNIELGKVNADGEPLNPAKLGELAASMLPKSSTPQEAVNSVDQLIKNWQSYNNLTNGGGKPIFPAIGQVYSAIQQQTGLSGDPGISSFVNNMNSLLAKEAGPSGLNRIMGSVVAPAITGALAGGILSGMGVTGAANKIASSLISSGGNPTKALTGYGLSSLADMTGATSLFGGTTTPSVDPNQILASAPTGAGTPFDVNAGLGYVPPPADLTMSNIGSTTSNIPLTDQITSAALGAGGLGAAGLAGISPDMQNSLSSLASSSSQSIPTGLTPTGSMPILNPYTGAIGGASFLGVAGLTGQGGGVTPGTSSAGDTNWLSDATGMSANTLGSLASGAAALYGANQAAGSASDAYALQKQSADAALAEQKRQFDLGQAAQMPWRTAGKTALDEQVNLMGLGSQGAEGQLASLMNAPGTQFRLDTGQKTLDRSASAKGGLFSGAAGKAMTGYGQNFASNEYGNRLSQLSSLSGQGQAAASGMAGQGTTYAGNTSNLLTGMGNAGAASSIAQGAAKQSGILGAGQALSNLFNPPKAQPTLADLLRGYNNAN